MAVRVTATEVKNIIDTNLSDAIVDVFITAANLIVTEILGNAGLTAAHLKEIERWLSAHLVAMRDPREARVTVGQATAVFEGSTGLGLNFTRYGQQVKVLDTSGLLNQAGKPAALFTVISEED